MRKLLLLSPVLALLIGGTTYACTPKHHVKKDKWTPVVDTTPPVVPVAPAVTPVTDTTPVADNIPPEVPTFQGK